MIIKQHNSLEEFNTAWNKVKFNILVIAIKMYFMTTIEGGIR